MIGKQADEIININLMSVMILLIISLLVIQIIIELAQSFICDCSSLTVLICFWSAIDLPNHETQQSCSNFLHLSSDPTPLLDCPNMETLLVFNKPALPCPWLGQFFPLFLPISSP